MTDHPKKVVVVLLDSLNRHMLGCYGGTEFATPNIDRLAKRSTRFTNHYTGSLPCMPARHDILVGALDFLWRPWGSIELWERPVTWHLRREGVITQLFTDHPHLFEAGGENYHTDFFAWEYSRGGEGDPWKTRPDLSWMGTPALPARVRFDNPDHLHAYDISRSYFRAEEDFPGPKTLSAAADWINTHGTSLESFFLFVDEFDPHEPFDTPEPWASSYGQDTNEELHIWPPYLVNALAEGKLTEQEAYTLRANYGSKLSMTDHWLGKILDAMDAQDLWDETLFILCTDHGLYLGEKDIWGKPMVPQYEMLGHTPLLISAPNVAASEIHALTTNVDIHATICDVFGVTPHYVSHGKSMMPLLNGNATSIRKWALGGVYGQWVQIQDGQNKYARAAVGDGFPLSMWSNRWSTMPVSLYPSLRLPDPDSRATLDTMPGTEIPVIRQPFQPGDLLPYWAMKPKVGEHHLYRIDQDPDELENRKGEPLEKEMIELLHCALSELEAPQEQFKRLGIA